jgi:hypothetical protein
MRCAPHGYCFTIKMAVAKIRDNFRSAIPRYTQNLHSKLYSVTNVFHPNHPECERRAAHTSERPVIFFNS